MWVLHSPASTTDCLCPASNTFEKAPLELPPLPRAQIVVARMIKSHTPPLGSEALEARTRMQAVLKVVMSVFEQLGCSQRVRCHEHIDVGIETVNRECLGKHETAWHTERNLQSNL